MVRPASVLQTGVVCVGLALLLIPALVVVPVSFSHSGYLSLWPTEWSARWYSAAVSSYWFDAVVGSLVVGLASAGLSAVVSLPASFYSATHRHAKTGLVLHVVAVLPLIVPAVSLATGYHRIFGEVDLPTLALGHAALGLPFAYFCQLYGFLRIDEDVLPVGYLAGATPMSVLFRIYIPSAKAAVFAGFLLAFLFSLDESVLSILITLPETLTLPKAAFETMTRERELTLAAVNTILLLILPVLVYFALARTVE